jgi:hypothetical protein
VCSDANRLDDCVRPTALVLDSICNDTSAGDSQVGGDHGGDKTERIFHGVSATVCKHIRLTSVLSGCPADRKEAIEAKIFPQDVPGRSDCRDEKKIVDCLVDWVRRSPSKREKAYAEEFDFPGVNRSRVTERYSNAFRGFTVQVEAYVELAVLQHAGSDR